MRKKSGRRADFGKLLDPQSPQEGNSGEIPANLTEVHDLQASRDRVISKNLYDLARFNYVFVCAVPA